MVTSDPAPEGSLRGPRAPRTHAVIVNHDSGSRLGPLLDVLVREAESVTVVDNSSSDGSAEPAARRERVLLLRNDSNRGFAAAANQGAAKAKADWLLFVNPDTRLHPGQVTALLTGVPEDVAAVAPLQVNEQGRPRSETGGYPPTLSRYLVWALLPVRFHRGLGPWLSFPFPERDAEVAWVSGALLAVNRAVFERLGGFDERFFLYHEDVDFCRRARAAGYRVVVRPSVHLYHEVAHGDAGRRVLSGLRSVESLALDFSGWRRRALGAILGLGFGLRALFASGTTRALARAALPHCATLLRGRLPHGDS